MFNFRKAINPADQRKRGVAIYFAAVILTLIMTIAIGVSYLSVLQIKNLNEASNAVVAFAAAETGIEWALENVTEDNYTSICPYTAALAGSGATFTVTVVTGGDCPVDYLCVKSVGNYLNSQRAIRIRR